MKEDKIKTVIFDMDGVIVDTEPVHRYAYFKHFEELGVLVSDDLFAQFTGSSTRNVYQKLKEKFEIDTDVESLVNRKRSIFNDAFDTKKDLCLLDGVADLIQDLYCNGMQLILASSASKVTIQRVFNRFDLHSYFSDVVSGEDFPKSKPDPAIFVHASSLSTFGKQNCIIIEDSTHGVSAAKAAGIFCVGYNSLHTEKQDLSHADLIINHFNELDFARISKLKEI